MDKQVSLTLVRPDIGRYVVIRVDTALTPYVFACTLDKTESSLKWCASIRIWTRNFWFSTVTRVTRGGMGWRKGSLPFPFSKIGKKCPNLEKKCPNCGHLWVKFLIWNEIFESFQAKKWRFYSLRHFFSLVLGECLRKCPNSKKTPLP